ncbi:hypothetical protein KX928_12680 [Roseobacter sp. YSTF-M11]|uniref:Uncharacterized protein n=1 Tax=Roseobacter insulae TaxID=2859783 RepID=A0A9X1FX44_9RHOB|nr:hypothetical protein [Roseobacter insulae]MBW4708640.1 hypothetical protein [Roseobacter insulae]
MTNWRLEMKEVETEKRRWSVLSHLEASKPTRSLSSDILIMGCRASGVPTTAEQMHDVLQWLQERQFITVESLGPMEVASITKEGREVAQRLRTVKGVLPFGLDG